MPEQARSPAVSMAIAWSGAVVFGVALAWFLYCYLVRFGAVSADGPILEPIVLDVVLFSVFALHHSVLARSGAKAVVRDLSPPALERSLYTWVASVLFIAVCALWRPVPGTLYRLDGGWALIGYAIQTIGLVLTIRGAAALDALDLAGVRQVLDAVHGRQPRHVPLETGGLYGFVRHPVYFAWVLLVFGTPSMSATRATFAVVSTLYLALAIPWEERSLVDAFGPRMIPFLY